ncbi:hypothetical protein ACUXEY_005622, partial [Bacillus sp. F9_6S_D1_P_5]
SRKVKLPVSYRIQETGSIGVFFMYQIRGSVQAIRSYWVFFVGTL